MPSVLRCSRPKVVPCRRIRQIQSPASRICLKHRTNENRGAKHELVAYVTNRGIRAPIHDQRALDGVVLIRNSPSEGIDVGHEAVAKLVEVDQDRLYFVVRPNLVLRPVSVRAEDRAEDSVLKPACIEFLKLRVGKRFFMRWPVTTDIRCPIGISGKCKV